MNMYDYKKQNREALTALLAFFNGNKAQLAFTLGVSRNAVSMWFTKGQIGRKGAFAADANKTVPFTKEQLRADIKNWSAYKKP